MIMKLTNLVLIAGKNICDSLQNYLKFGEVPTSLVDNYRQIPSALHFAIQESRQSKWSSHSS